VGEGTGSGIAKNERYTRRPGLAKLAVDAQPQRVYDQSAYGNPNVLKHRN